VSRLGIIGAGQLALYLCEAAQALGSAVAILAEPGDAPALAIADRPFRYTSGNSAVVEDFIANCDVVTFDKEAIPEEILLLLEAAEQQGRIAVRPGTNTLQLLQDKAMQKAWLVEHNLPTLPFVVLSDNCSPVSDLTAKLGSAVVQKARCGGYDGRGVQILARLESAQQLWNVPSIVEPYLPQSREISVIVARTRSGEIQDYPPMSMEFDHQLNSVIAVTIPAAITPSQCDAASSLARKAVSALDGVGVFAVEMFINAAGELLVNEISPRVHNSGHVTLDACNVSQFEQHARAVLDLPLVSIGPVTPAAMLNVLDSQELRTGFPSRPATVSWPELAATVYWYGKTPGRTGRKMGHINTLAASAGEALELAKQARGKLADSKSGWAA